MRTYKKKKPPVQALAAEPLPEVERTAEGLRDALFDELNLLRAGKATTAHARALGGIARLIIESARLEVRHIEELRRAGNSLPLGKLLNGRR